MGNKDRGKREIRKPKKKIPKQAPPRRDVNQTAAHIVRDVTEK
jgi:hypothetical protein